MEVHQKVYTAYRDYSNIKQHSAVNYIDRYTDRYPRPVCIVPYMS